MGSGDAFSNEGRFQSSYLVKHNSTTFLMDCGSTIMVSIHLHKIDPNEISHIFLSHLHGDHIGGIPFFLLDAQWNSHRNTPLVIAGPRGTQTKTMQLMECLYEGISIQDLNFNISFKEYATHATEQFENFTLKPFTVIHSDYSNPHGLRFEFSDKVLAYTGDTSWTNNLIPLMNNADVAICECCTRTTPLPNHMNYATLLKNRESLNAKRMVLTHLTECNYSPVSPFEFASDGQIISA